MEDKITIKWIIGIAIGVLAAGGGGVAWLEYFASKSEGEDTLSWDSLQTNYLETYDIAYTDPAMQAVWPTFKDNLWSGEISNGTYCYSSTKDESGVQYNYVGIDQEDVSNTPVSVEVNTKNFSNSTPISAGGLLYRFDESSAYYYAFTISKDGLVYFYRKNQDGFNVLHTGKSALYVADSFNKLAIIGKGNSLHLYINDSLERIVKDDNLRSGDSGIIGIGIGQHCFDNFTIYQNTDQLPGIDSS